MDYATKCVSMPTETDIGDAVLAIPIRNFWLAKKFLLFSFLYVFICIKAGLKYTQGLKYTPFNAAA